MLLIVTGKKAPDLSGPKYRTLLTFTLPLKRVPPTTTPTPRTSYTPERGGKDIRNMRDRKRVKEKEVVRKIDR